MAYQLKQLFSYFMHRKILLLS